MKNNDSVVMALLAAMAILAYGIIVGSVQKAVNKGLDKMFISMGIGVVAGVIAYFGLAAVFAGFFGSIAILTTLPAAISAVFFGLIIYVVVFDII